MQAQISDNYIYKGNVDVTIKIGNKIINKTFHNNGTEQLKRAFAMFMCGGTVAETAKRYLPTKVDLKYTASSANTWDTTLLRPVPVTNPTYDYDYDNIRNAKQWYVLYNAVIPYSVLKNDINESYSYRLYLTCEGTDSLDKSDEIAYIDINTEDILTLQAGVSILIAWKLKILNDSEI